MFGLEFCAETLHAQINSFLRFRILIPLSVVQLVNKFHYFYCTQSSTSCLQDINLNQQIQYTTYTLGL
jgi:hypothetical protein